MSDLGSIIEVSECLTQLPVDRVHAAINELLAQP